MVPLTEEQIRAMEREKAPLQLVNPHTQEVYFLIRHDIYKLTSSILKTWDDPEDGDLIEAAHETR